MKRFEFFSQATLAFVFALASIEGCAKPPETKTEDLPMKIRCFDLPTVRGGEIIPTSDFKKIYYIGPITSRPADDKSISPFGMLVSVNIATAERHGHASDINGFDLMADDRIVVWQTAADSGGNYEPGKLFALAPGSNLPVPIRPSGVGVSNVAIDDKTSKVVYATAYRRAYSDAPIDIGEFTLEGKSEIELRISKESTFGKGAQLLGMTNGVALVHFDKEKAGLVSLANGSLVQTYALGDSESVVGMTADHVIMMKRTLGGQSHYRSEALIKEADKPEEKSDPLADIESGYTKLSARLRHSSEFIAAVYPGKTQLYRVTKGKANKVLTLKGAESSNYVSIGPRSYAFAVCQDSNDNGSCDDDDDRDVCVAENVPEGREIKVPTRKVPRRMVKLLEKLAPLTKELELDGARILNSLGAAYAIEIESSKNGPTDVKSLWAVAKVLQKRVTELSEQPELGVRIRYANGVNAQSRFDKQDERFITFGGMGMALVRDSEDYDLSYLPKVITNISGGVEVSVTCDGDVTNVSNKPLAIVSVECTREPVKGDSTSNRAYLTPVELAPGAKGKYHIEDLPAPRWDKPIYSVKFRISGKNLRAYNRFAAERAQKLYDGALKVQAATSLVYEKDKSYDGYRATIEFLAPESFATLDDRQKKAACEKAIAGLSTTLLSIDSDVAKPQVDVVLLDPKTRQERWKYNDGRLEAISVKEMQYPAKM